MMMRDLAIGAFVTAVAASSASAASIDLSQDIQARGAKPDWSVTVANGTKVTLSRRGNPVVQATAPGAAISPGGVTLAAKTADGQSVSVSLKISACTLAGKAYPMSAEVTLGAETLKGCAAPKP